MFFVVGRLGNTLVYQKVVPFIKTGIFKEVYVFAENKGNPINSAKYILIPKIIKNIKPKIIRKIIIRIYEPIQILHYALKYKPDYINGIFTIPKGLNAFLVSKIVNSKSIVSVIGGVIEIKTYRKPQFYWENLNFYMLKNTKIVTTVGSKVTKYLVQNGVKKNKIFEFAGFVDTEVFYNKKIDRDIDILFVGTFRKLKGPDRIVKMVKIVKNNFPNINAVFLGTGYLFNEVNLQINKFKLNSNISLLGYRKDTESFYQRAKILVMPSRSEGLSMAMLESMACGCVPVVSNVGNLTDAAFNGTNSFVIDDYNDIDSFVDKIQFLLENPDKRDEMAKNAIELVQKKYSLEPQTKIALEIIDYGEQL
jgi:glycosyltransferase involved in cell wall biosynthesis